MAAPRRALRAVSDRGWDPCAGPGRRRRSARRPGWGPAGGAPLSGLGRAAGAGGADAPLGGNL